MGLNKKWVIFDFDGTIAETDTALVKFYNERLVPRYKCRKLENSDLELLKKMSVKEKLNFLQISFFKLPFAIGRARKEFPPYLKDIPVIEGFERACRDLIDSGYTLAILSSNKKENIESYLAKNGLTDFFKEIRCDKGRSLFVKHKTIKRFLKRIGLKTSDIVYVGDEGRDVIACRKIGVSVLSATWGWDSKDVLKEINGDFLVDTPSDIPILVDKIFNS